MKAKLYVCVLLTALIAVFTISGCNKAPESEPAATLDEVTVTDVVESSTADTTSATTTVTTTVAPTETTAAETTTAPTEPTTKAEEVTEAVEVNQTSYDDNNDNNASTNTQKPNNTSNSNNVSGNTTNNTSTNKSSNEEKPKPVETKPKETQPPVTEAPAVITDDTPLTFEQMNTAENMQKIVDACNAYFETLGMTYNEELDPSWAGWYYGRQGGLCVFDTCSLNEEKRLVAGTIKQQVDGILIDYYGCEYTDITYKTVYVVNELDGYYDIVFCYG